MEILIFWFIGARSGGNMRRLSLGIVFTVFLIGLTAAQTPKTAAEYIDRGADRSRIGEIDDAISDFSKAIELDNSALKGPEIR